MHGFGNVFETFIWTFHSLCFAYASEAILKIVSELLNFVVQPQNSLENKIRLLLHWFLTHLFSNFNLSCCWNAAVGLNLLPCLSHAKEFKSVAFDNLFRKKLISVHCIYIQTRASRTQIDKCMCKQLIINVSLVLNNDNDIVKSFPFSPSRFPKGQTTTDHWLHSLAAVVV